MRKVLLSFIILLTITIAGCSQSESSPNKMTGDKPPVAMIKINEESFSTILGSYCWTERNKSTCVDTAGPVELLKNVEPIGVQAGEVVTFKMDYEPKPNQLHVIQIHQNQNEEIEVDVEDFQFAAPMKEGVYYYSFGVWWMDEKAANISNGDAFYAFALEVK